MKALCGDRLVFLRRAHLRPTVQVGAQVVAGDLLLEASSIEHAHTPAPCPGEVVAIEADRILLAPLPEISPTTMEACDLTSRRACAERLQRCGIIGMGGGGFPTHRKLLALPETVDLVLINAVECDPWLRADLTLATHEPRAVMRAVELLQSLLGPGQLRIATGPHTDAAVRAIDAGLPRLETDGSYTSGWERRLLDRVGHPRTGPNPAASGALTLNLATAVAMSEALLDGRGLEQRYVTVGGDETFAVTIGTAVADVLPPDPRARSAIKGGTMYSVDSVHSPIEATTAGVRPLAEGVAQWPCIRCGDCRPACPVGIRPEVLFARGAEAPSEELLQCIRCGACDLVCPSQLPLAHGIGLAQRDLAAQQRQAQSAERASLRHRARQLRLQARAQEGQGRRSARLDRLRRRPRS